MTKKLGLGSLLFNLLLVHWKLSDGFRLFISKKKALCPALQPSGLQVIVIGGLACPDYPGAAPDPTYFNNLHTSAGSIPPAAPGPSGPLHYNPH